MMDVDESPLGTQPSNIVRPRTVRPNSWDQQIASYLSGVNDSLYFGLSDEHITPFLQKHLLGRDIVPYSGTAKDAGEYSALFMGGGRAAYTGYVNTIPKMASADDKAVGLRKKAKGAFSMLGNRHPGVKSVESMIEKYGSEQAVIDAAGRTNQAVNNAFAALATGSVTARTTGGGTCD